MGLINIDDLKAGMVLAADLSGSNGRFLLPRGTELDERKLRVLKIWGVTQADIEGVSQEEAEASSLADLDPAVLEMAARYADRLFSMAGTDHPALREMRRLSVLRLAPLVLSGLVDPGREEDRSEALELYQALSEQPEELPASARALVGSELELASFPDIYFQIVEVLKNPRSSATHAADVVSKDTSLTARLLRLVNSPFYGFPSRIDSITRAITLIGSNELSMLALGVSVVQHFRDVPPDLMNMKLFWQHAISCGVFAKLLAGHMVGLSEERFFVAGLIHDIGRLVLAKNYPQTATRVLLLAKSRPCTLPEAEQEVLGFDHAEVGRLLLRGWKFPTSLEQVVGYHHKPMRAQHVVETGILHVANVMAHAFLMHGGAPLYVPPLDGQAWEELDLSPSVIAPAMRQAERQVEDIFQAFLSKE